MRTNIVLDDELVNEAFKHTEAKTKSDLVHIALKEFVENHRRKNMLDLLGKVQLAPDYDHKKLRRRSGAAITFNEK